jgi:hypothetical protein
MTIADPSWSGNHWKSISMNYAKARYFDQYKDGLKDLYDSAVLTSLSETNRQFLLYFCSVLGIKTRITNSTDYELVEDKNLRLVHICKQLGADTYCSGPAAKSYLDEELFKANGIRVVWMDYGGYPEYEQVHPPFTHAVSVVDLLLNQGPDATKYMKSFNPALLAS